MAWKIDGKIATHFPNAGGAANRDTYRILFAPPNATQETELLDIEKVYFVPAGATVTQSNLQDYLVWHRYVAKTLLAGNQDVAIEYFNTESDVTVHHIGIFTANTPDSTTQCIKIMHESGTVLAQINADSVSAQTTKYGLAGYLRTAAVNNIVFHKNQKYYIMYTDNRTTSDYYPAYFENEIGNYKAFKNRDNKSIADLNDCEPYLGWISILDDFIAGNENTIMVYSNNDGTLNQGVVYVRNDVLEGSEYAGTIGDKWAQITPEQTNQILSLTSGTLFYWIGSDLQSSQTTVLRSGYIGSRTSTLPTSKYKGLKNTIKSLLVDLSENDYAVWNGENEYGTVPQMNPGKVYKKTTQITVEKETTFNGESDDIKTCKVMDLSYNYAGTNKYVAPTGLWYYATVTGNLYQLKSGYVPDFNKSGDTYTGYSAADLTSLISNHIYYISTGGSCPATGSQVNAGVYYYDGNSLTSVGQGTYQSYFNIILYRDAMTVIDMTDGISEVGTISSLIKSSYTGNYISTTCRETATSNTKKYYLEVNGNEV